MEIWKVIYFACCIVGQNRMLRKRRYKVLVKLTKCLYCAFKVFCDVCFQYSVLYLYIGSPFFYYISNTTKEKIAMAAMTVEILSALAS